MTHRLSRRLDQLEAATEQLLASAEALGPRAHTRPGPGQWSAAQVVHHLLVTETAIIGQVEKKLGQAAAGRPSLTDSLQALLVRVALRLPGVRVRAPRGVGELTETTAIGPLPALRAEWAAARRRLERLLHELPGSHLHQSVFRHPRAGQMNIDQTLTFILDHVLHHQQQLGRIASQLRVES